MPIVATRTVTVASSAGSSSSWIPMDIHNTPFNVGFGVVTTDTVAYRIEHTFDDVQDSTVTPTAFTHEDVSAATGNADGNYAFPVKAIRLTMTTAAGSGQATLTVIQAC